jgi:hypothetical protein
VVECLPSKCKVPSSNPNAAKRKKNPVTTKILYSFDIIPCAIKISKDYKINLCRRMFMTNLSIIWGGDIRRNNFSIQYEGMF